MEHTESHREPLEELAEEFAERQRRGERPTIREYVEKCPELAAEIRELFPALQVMEELKPGVAGVPLHRTAGSASGEPPTVLGDYCILREVGRGGMGIVYEAEQKSLGRRVALKVLSNRLLVNEKQQKRFEHEARTAARLHHTNIVPVFGIGQHDGVCYYVMQFIQGQGLEEVLVEVRRLRDRASSRRGEDGTERSEHTVEISAAYDQVHTCTDGSAAQRAAFSMLTGQYERKQLLHSAGDSADGPLAQGPQPLPLSDRLEFTKPAVESIESSETSNSSSSLSLLFAKGSASGSWSASRSTYYRSVARIGVQAADALHYAHGQGVLHRDVKPSNVMLDAQGNVWITDFGLAKAEDQQSLTQTGDIVGTLRYMAPEMFSGHADARSDVCELGLTLYEMLALRPAFDEIDRSRLVRQVLNLSPPRLDTIDRHIPRDLVTIVHKAIDHEQATRYRTAAELRDDLNRFLHDEPIRARPISLVARGGRWCKRNPAIALLLGTVAMLLLVVAIVSSVAALRFRALAHQLVDKKTEAETARDAAKDSQEEALRNLWQAYLSQARASRWSGRSGQRLDSLDALAKAAELVPRLGLGGDEEMVLRTEAIACMALTDLRIVKEWKRPPTVYFGAIGFSPDLECYARPDTEGGVTVRHVVDDDVIANLPTNGEIDVLRFSSDGKFLCVRCRKEIGHSVDVWNIAEQKIVHHVVSRGTHWSGGQWCLSPNGQLFAMDIGDGSICIFNLATGAEMLRLSLTSEPSHICFHPDGEKLAVGSVPGKSIEVWDLKTRSVLHRFDHPQGILWVAWRADGELLAAACSDRCAYIWKVDPEELLHVLKGHKEVVHHVNFHPTQNFAVSHSWDGMTRVWSLADGSSLLAVEGYAIQFAANGRRLAFRNGLNLGLWEIPERPECETLYGKTELSEDIRGVAISPNGNLMASGALHDCGTRLWDLTTFKQLATLPTGSTPSIRFHPTDGSLITSSDRGLLKWPIERHTKHASERLVIGPPVSLGNRSEMCLSSMDMSPNGNFFAAETADLNRAIVIDAAHNSTTNLSDGRNRPFVAVSPGGRWVARGNYGLSGVEVWDAQTGKILQNLPIEGSAAVAFSPDGRWLVIAAKVYQFLETGSWQQRHSISGIGGGNQGGRMAFSPDGQMMAITLACNLVQLIETDTGRVLADLQVTPKPSWVQWLSFSADGSRLAVACGREGIRVWDLRRVRQRLGTMDLDWDLPCYPPTAQVADQRPLEVQVDLGPLAGALHLKRCRDHVQAGQLQEALDAVNKAVELNDGDTEAFELRAQVYIALKQYEQAVEDFSKAIELRPRELYRDGYELALVQLAAGNTSGYQQACTELMNCFGETTDPKVASLVAWTNVLDSTSVADWSVVINLAERATKITADDDSLAQVALGAALYRADRFAEAVAQLTEADRQMQEAGLTSSSSHAYVWYFLALAQHGLNHQDESRQWFERAIQWKKQSLQHESQDDAATIPWNRRVTLELLEKETRSLIGG